MRAAAIAGLLTVSLLAAGCVPEDLSDSPGAGATVHPRGWPAVSGPLGLDSEIETVISELLAAMTLEEKVGQVIQPEINSVTPEEVEAYHLGSVLNGGGGWPGGDKRSTVEDWLALADAFWEASMETSDGGQAIPILWGLDAVHGHNNVIGATLFPHNIGLGAANEPGLIREIGRVTAREVRVTGQDWDFGPTVAVARDDRWGRTYESYSEDPEVVRAYAAAMVEGLQGRVGGEDFLDGEHLIATAKHFLADGGTEGGKDQGDSTVSEEELREIHAAGYYSAIESGVQSVMASFSSWRGKKIHGNRALLTDLLKGRMGFDGIVVGDWNAHGQLPGCSNESCPEALLAGVDIFMVPQDWRALYENTLAQVRSREMDEARLDDAVRRILRVKMRAGLFERGKPSERALGGRSELLGAPEHRALARRAVRRSLVLLKNNGRALPLSPTAHVLVAGDGADDVAKQSGGWTLTWQGSENSNDDFPGATTIWEGIRQTVEEAGGIATLSADGGYTDRPDAAIVVFGEDPYAEFQGDLKWIVYDEGRGRDLALLRKLRDDGIVVVSLFLSGRPLWVNPEINASDAFVAAWLPGTEGGGIADLIFAASDGSVRYDFTGRLSFSWPRSADQAVINRGDDDYDPLFPYGYGLTYSEESDLGELSENSGVLTVRSVRSRTVYFSGGPVPPWQLFARSGSEPEMAVEVGGAVVARAGGLEIRAVDREAQEDARAVRWTGTTPSAISLRADEPLDLHREANSEMALSFDLLVEEPPSAPVRLSLGCGASCSGAVDVTTALDQLATGEWNAMVVRLRCFEEGGADMSRIDAPFSVETAGTLSLRFSEVKLVSASEDEAVCP